MKVKFTIFICFVSSCIYAQSFIKQWDRRFGGSNIDYVTNVLKTSSGNVMIGGVSLSDSSGDKTQNSYSLNNEPNCWVVYVDSNGNKLWDKDLGGDWEDECLVLLETPDHAFLVGGFTDSDISGDITHPDIENSSTGRSTDFLLLKIDSNGNKLWDNRYGGYFDEVMTSIVNTRDGGYLLGGWSNSNISGDKSDSSRGEYDFWIIKVDSLGNKQWDKTYGGDKDDELYKITNTFDGGYLLTGWSNSDSSGEKTQANWDTSGASSDYWIVKIDSAGNKIWDRRFGGTNFDVLEDCVQISDSGFLLLGGSESDVSGNKTAPLLGSSDYWLVRIDKNGNMIWDIKYGGYDYDEGNSISKTSDGGFLLAGGSYSGIGGDKTQANLGSPTDWIVKIDSGGNKIWDKTLLINGSEYSEVFALQDYTNCYYFIGSPYNAGIGGDKSQNSRGQSDYWISKWLYTTMPPVALFQSNDTVFCANACINFTNLSTNAASWQWSFVGGNPDTSTAQNPQGICYLNEGNYNVSLIASSANGTDTFTINNYITVLSSPPTPTINQVGNTVYCKTDTSYTSYQWFFDSTLIANATDTFYVATQNGNYNVEVKNSNGCIVGAGIVVTTVGMEQFMIYDSRFTIAPNPSSDEILIKSNSLKDKVSISVIDVFGQIVYSGIETPAGILNKNIDVSNFSSGIYFVRVSDQSGMSVLKFVKE